MIWLYWKLDLVKTAVSSIRGSDFFFISWLCLIGTTRRYVGLFFLLFFIFSITGMLLLSFFSWLVDFMRVKEKNICMYFLRKCCWMIKLRAFLYEYVTFKTLKGINYFELLSVFD